MEWPGRRSLHANSRPRLPDAFRSAASDLCPAEVAGSANRYPSFRALDPAGLLVIARESAKPAGRNARPSVSWPKMADLEEGFTLTAVPLGSGPDGPLGVEQSDKTDQFLVTDSGRTVILYKVRALGSECPRCRLVPF